MTSRSQTEMISRLAAEIYESHSLHRDPGYADRVGMASDLLTAEIEAIIGRGLSMAGYYLAECPNPEHESGCVYNVKTGLVECPLCGWTTTNEMGSL